MPPRQRASEKRGKPAAAVSIPATVTATAANKKKEKRARFADEAAAEVTRNDSGNGLQKSRKTAAFATAHATTNNNKSDKMKKNKKNNSTSSTPRSLVEVTTYNAANPVTHYNDTADFDFSEYDREAKRQLLWNRMKNARINPSSYYSSYSVSGTPQQSAASSLALASPPSQQGYKTQAAQRPDDGNMTQAHLTSPRKRNANTTTKPTSSPKLDTSKQQQQELSQVTPPIIPQQAFSIFSIPVILDTNFLSHRDLKKELSVRGLRTDGPKAILRERLDRYIKANERDIVKAHSGRTSTELGISSTPISASSASQQHAKAITKKEKK